MIELTIDKQKVRVPEGNTILDAAARLGITIPTLCYMEGLEPETSCMICIVEDLDSGKLVPACATPAAEGMNIRTGGEKVRDSRQLTLELLFSEHLGDCNPPCQQICPAHLDVQKILGWVSIGQFEKAYREMEQSILFPGILGHICFAPCESGCRRNRLDSGLKVRDTERGLAAKFHNGTHEPHHSAVRCQERIAVVGAGPAGCAAAVSLSRMGYGVTLFDKGREPGGGLLKISPNVLPSEVIIGDLKILSDLGIQFIPEQKLGETLQFSRLRDQFAGIVLALGEINPKNFSLRDLETGKRGIKVHPGTFETSIPRVWAVGSTVQPGQIAIRSVAHGKTAAAAVHQTFRQTQETADIHRDMNSHLGKLNPKEIPEFEKLLDIRNRQLSRLEPELPSLNALQSESARCLQCGCQVYSVCRLRKLGSEYQINPDRFKAPSRKDVEIITSHPHVLYEPGKCIKCGLCIKISQKEQSGLGLTFIGRGFDVRVGVPFDEDLEKGLSETAAECVRACPSGALVLKELWRWDDD